MNKQINLQANPQEVIVNIANVNKWYDDFQVLKNINLQVHRGQKFIICGPSGSGKSTLIRCLNRLEVHQKGEIDVLGVRLSDHVKDLAFIRANVGMVFQQFNLFPHLTILQNCMLAPMKVQGKSHAEAMTLAMHYLEKVKIPEQANKYPAALSGGQQQRVAIARTLCMQPQLILFDEPTSALDPEMIKEVLDVMTALAQDGMTMICVTHEMGFARSIADQIVFMAEGEIIESAQPEVFFTAPKMDRTKVFLEQIIKH